jgi:hypothetical protein
MKHRWYATKAYIGWYCSTCQVSTFTVEKPDGGECMAARHADPEINKLYRARRKAAEAANGSGWSASRGWADMDRIEATLREVDPDGDWRYEGNHYDGLGWRVVRDGR